MTVVGSGRGALKAGFSPRRALVACAFGALFVACSSPDEENDGPTGTGGDTSSGGDATSNGTGGSDTTNPLGTGGRSAGSGGSLNGSGGDDASEGSGGQTSSGGEGSGGADTASGERALGSSDGDGTGCADGSVVDACGICDGDGSSCDCLEGELCWDIVFEHNEVRREVNLGIFSDEPAADPPIAMVGWDPLIEAKAQEYASSIDDWSQGHSSQQFRTYQSTHHDGYHGENMAIGGGQFADPHEFVYNAWSLEETHNCERGGCGGHYTQVVWRESVWIGCGRKDDVPFEVEGQTYEGTLTVCQYGPGGNSGGDPY
jgi:hypothetical protein